MPNIPTPSAQANSPRLLDAIEMALLEYIPHVLSETYIPSGNPGYVAQQKRFAYCQIASNSPEYEARRAAPFVSAIEPEMTINEKDTYRYLVSDNPGGTNVFAQQPLQVSWSGAVGMGTQLFDVLAGVNSGDLI